MLSYRSPHAAPAVAGGHRGLAPPSPFSVLVSPHWRKYGCARSLPGNECHSYCHHHRHIHRCVAPTMRSFTSIQVTPPAYSELDHHFSEAKPLSPCHPLFVGGHIASVAFSVKLTRTPTLLRGFSCALLLQSRWCCKAHSMANLISRINCRHPFFNCCDCCRLITLFLFSKTCVTHGEYTDNPPR